MFRKLIITLSLAWIEASVHVHDLTNNPLAIIPMGNAKIKTGYVRVVHPIDLIQIGNTIAKINDDIQRNPFNNPLYELIQIKNQKLYETFLKLKPFVTKQKRSIEIIGTVWKWIAGNPDAEDLRLINSSINSLIIQNNRQILINEAIDKRIQEITDITNQVLTIENERTKNHSIEINQLIVLSNLDSLQSQVETLEEAILMAKHGIPSSKLLSMRDFSKIATFLQHHDVHMSSFEELLSQADAQVLLNHTHIIYMLKVPQVSATIYEYNYVDSIIKSGKRISLNKNYIVKNYTHIFEVTEPCEERNNYFLCESTQLAPINECIYKLINGQHSNCTFEKVYSTGLIKRINDGIILINNAIAEITSNCTNSSQPLNGSFLIQINQCDVHINGELYTNYDFTLPQRAYYPTTGLNVNEMHIIDEPPMEYLQNLTLEHREELKTLKLHNYSLGWKFNLFGGLGFSTITIILISITILCLISRKRQPDIRVAFNKQMETVKLDTIQTQAPSSSPASPENKSIINFNELLNTQKKELNSFLETPNSLHSLPM